MRQLAGTRGRRTSSAISKAASWIGSRDIFLTIRPSRSSNCSSRAKNPFLISQWYSATVKSRSVVPEQSVWAGLVSGDAAIGEDDFTAERWGGNANVVMIWDSTTAASETPILHIAADCSNPLHFRCLIPQIPALHPPHAQQIDECAKCTVAEPVLGGPGKARRVLDRLLPHRVAAHFDQRREKQ